MTEVPTPPPATEALTAGTSNLEPDVPELWRMFVTPATIDNYSQIARDQAAARGVDPSQVMSELADQFEALHARQPLDGYDHLAQWARQHDPSAGAFPSGLTVLEARALESARRDPYQAVIGDQALVEQGVTAQKVADAQTAATIAAPSVDPASGMAPNPGPLPVPDASRFSSDPAVAEQQQAAEQQREPGEQLPQPDAAPAPEPAPEPAPADAAKPKRSSSSGDASS